MKITLTNLKNNKEAGFGLMELLVSMAITAAVASLIVTAIFQLRSAHKIVQDNNVAVQQLWNLNYWLGRDVMSAQSLNDENGLINLDYTQRGIGSLDNFQYEINVSYSFDNHIVWRNEHIITSQYGSQGDLVNSWENSHEQMIASNIENIVVNIDANTGVVQVSATALADNYSKTETFTIQQRVG